MLWDCCYCYCCCTCSSCCFLVILCMCMWLSSLCLFYSSCVFCCCCCCCCCCCGRRRCCCCCCCCCGTWKESLWYTTISPCCRLCHCMSLSSTCYHHHHHHHHHHHQIKQPSHWWSPARTSLQLQALINITECIMSQSFLLGCVAPSHDPFFRLIHGCAMGKSPLGTVIPLLINRNPNSGYLNPCDWFHNHPPILVISRREIGVSQLGVNPQLRKLRYQVIHGPPWNLDPHCRSE